MFVLVENNNVILGPMHWNSRMFQHVLIDELEINFSIPLTNDTNEPIIISNNVKILPVQINHPMQINSKIEQLAGPFWEFTDTLAIGTYHVVSKPIDMIQNELKAIVADNRWQHEISGITVNIQGQDVIISTERGIRDVYSQAIQLNSDGKSWKIGNKWFTLSLAELQTIANAISDHVHSAFAWEQSKVQEIDNANLFQLDTITLTVN